jgi:hypothetical protein
VFQQRDVCRRCDPWCYDAKPTRQGREQWSTAVINGQEKKQLNWHLLTVELRGVASRPEVGF